MIKVSEAVEELINGDEIALEAHKIGILNLSAYAKTIKPTIEKMLLKPAEVGTIVVALSRIKTNTNNSPALKPHVKIEELSIKSPLSDITYYKNVQTLKALSKLPGKLAENGFLTITQGINEITIICSKELEKDILKYFETAPKGKYEDLVALTAKFDEKEYIEVPNMIFTLGSALATKRINLIEIVSTYSEISFIVKNADMQTTIDSLKQFLS